MPLGITSKQLFIFFLFVNFFSFFTPLVAWVGVAPRAVWPRLPDVDYLLAHPVRGSTEGRARGLHQQGRWCRVARPRGGNC